MTRVSFSRPKIARRRTLAAGFFGGVLVAAAAGGVTQALDRTWTTDADFNAGTSVDVVVAGDVLSLAVDGVGVPDASIDWWDATWGQRRCIEITNNEATPLTEYQIALSVDTATPIVGGRMDANGDDLRFISSDGSTELDYWIEGPINDLATSIWLQTDTLLPGASTICMYFDNVVAPAQSDIYAPFTYTTPRDLYVAVSESQVGDPIAVTSYVASNTISDGIASVTLGVGGTHTFPGAGHTAATVVSASGPIAIQGTANNADSFVPLAFAGTDFVIASTRNTNRLSLYAPFADASVTIEHSGTVTVVPVPAGTSVSTDADVTAATQSAVISSDQPILVTHQASGLADALVAVPTSDLPLYGIRSTVHITGFGGAGTSVDVNESDGSSVTILGGAGEAISRGSGGSQGSGPAVISTPTTGGPINAIQQADSDGSESTSHWPLSELNVIYRIPVDMEYVAFACPEQNAGNLESDGTVLDCTGTGGAGFPGKARDAAGLVAGDLFQSLDGQPFYMYAEDSAFGDENNVLGPKQARLSTANQPTFAVGPEQSQYVSAASWTSDAHDTGCGSFFGDIAWNPATQAAGTSVEFQVATATAALGPFTFLGPDGTAATTYASAIGSPISAVHDGDRFVEVSVALASDSERISGPVVTDVTVEAVGETTVSGVLFSDVDGNAVNDAADPGLDGVETTLWLDDGNGLFDSGADTEVTTTSSASGGTYSFDGIPAGSYFVIADESQLPAGHLAPGTSPNPAGPIGAPECGVATVDIGWQAVGAVQVTVFSDLDGNGSSDGTDPVLAGVEVELWSDDGDRQFDPTTDTRVNIESTNGSGQVSFSELPLGDYFARIADADAPDGHLVTATTDNPSGPVAVSTGVRSVNEIGFQPIGVLSGTAFADDNGDQTRQEGEDGVRQLFIDVYRDDGDGIFDPSLDTIVTTVHTNPLGDYVVPGLASGEYWLVPFDPPLPSLPSNPVAASVTEGSTVVDVPFAQAESISGYVVFDADGIRDERSTPVAGVAVTLFRDDGNGAFDAGLDEQVAVTTSNADGAFVFDDLPPGQYFAQVGASAFLTLAGAQIIGDNPLGPIEPGTGDLVFAFDPLSIELPQTGSLSVRSGLGLGSLMLAAGIGLLLSARRRSDVLA